MLIAKLKSLVLGFTALAFIATGVTAMAQIGGPGAKTSSDDRLKVVEQKLDKLLEVMGASAHPAPIAAPAAAPAPGLLPVPPLPPTPAGMPPSPPGTPVPAPAGYAGPGAGPPQMPGPIASGTPYAASPRRDVIALADRVKALEHRLNEMERRLADMEKRIQPTGPGTSPTGFPPGGRSNRAEASGSSPLFPRGDPSGPYGTYAPPAPPDSAHLPLDAAAGAPASDNAAPASGATSHTSSP
jgi:hypothetical protein